MSVGYELAEFVIDFLSVLNLVNRESTEWQKQKLKELLELKRQKRINEAYLEQELQVLMIEFSGELKRKQEEEQRITTDYKEFLDSIDEMKQKMLETFTDMPKPMVHVIHHHAKHLIDGMWKSHDEHSQALSRSRFTNFLMAVYSDTTQALIEDQKPKLPTETLGLINPTS